VTRSSTRTLPRPPSHDSGGSERVSQASSSQRPNVDIEVAGRGHRCPGRYHFGASRIVVPNADILQCRSVAAQRPWRAGLRHPAPAWPLLAMKANARVHPFVWRQRHFPATEGPIPHRHALRFIDAVPLGAATIGHESLRFRPGGGCEHHGTCLALFRFRSGSTRFGASRRRRLGAMPWPTHVERRTSHERVCGQHQPSPSRQAHVRSECMRCSYDIERIRSVQRLFIGQGVAARGQRRGSMPLTVVVPIKRNVSPYPVLTVGEGSG
jgi:hypothetical protein